MKKRIIILSLIFTVVLSATGCFKEQASSSSRALAFRSFREVPGITAEEISAIEELQREYESFSYGAFPSNEAFIRSDGTIGGYASLFCEWLTDFFGIPFVPEHTTWNGLLDGLKKGQIDFTGDLTPSDERRQNYIMTDATTHRWLCHFRLEGAEPLAEITRSRPVRYVLVEGSTNTEDVLRYSTETFEVIYATAFEDTYEILKSGRADTLVAENTSEAFFDDYGGIVTETFFPLIDSPVSLSTQNPKLEPVISVVQKVLGNGGYRYFSELYDRGYEEYKMNKLLLKLTPEEREYIKANPVIPYAAEYDNYPSSFYNTRIRQWQGVIFDVLKEVQALTGLEFSLANDEHTDWHEILEMLETGRVLFVAELLWTEEREGRFLWPSSSIFIDRPVLISRADHDNISINKVPAEKVGLPKATAHAELFERWFPNHQNTVTYESQEATYEALFNGEVDMAMISYSNMLYITNYLERVDIKPNIIFDHIYESTFGFYKDAELLCSIFDKALELIDLSIISDQWTQRTYDYRAMIAEARLPWLIGAVALSLLVLALVVIILYRNRKVLVERAVLRESEGRIQLLLNSTPLGVNLVDKDFQTLFVNEETMRLFGIKNEKDYHDKLFTDLSPEYQPDGSLSAVNGPWLVRETFKKGYQRFEWMHKKQDGEPLPCEITMIRVKYKDEYVIAIYIRDLREEKKMLKNIQEGVEAKNALAVLGSILDSIDVNIYASNPKTGELLFVNKRLRALFGMENKDLAGHYCYKVFRNIDEPCESCPCTKLDENPEQIIVWEKYELGKHFLHSDCYIDWPNGEKVHLQHAIDISDMKNMTDTLDKQLRLQSLMANISQSFLSNDDVDTLLTNALEKVGEFLGIAQILLFKAHDDDEHTIICQNEWINPKFDLPSRVGGKMLISDKMMNIFKSLNNPEKFYITADDPGVKEEMAQYRQNFKNYLTACILIENKLYAVVDFSRDDDVKWNREEIQIASYTSNIISGVLQKHVVQKQLINAKEFAEQSSRYKTDFLARMSHEIRTPMNAIMGMTELALREETPKAKDEHVLTVKHAASNLLAIINDILDFSKIEAGKMEIITDDYSLSSLLNDVISITRMKAADSEIRFAVKADSNIPGTLIGDETRVRQVVLNILNNAVKYTEKGFVSFGIYGESIDEETVNITFEVTDTGIGIKEEDIGRLFSDFTQFDLKKNRSVEGVGLGLAISKNIVEAMNGNISVQSEYGKGSTFTIKLPQKYHSHEPLAKIENPEEKKVLILIYERRDVNADSLTYTLNNLGVDCTIVTKGTELYLEMESHTFNYLFIPYALYMKNEDTILKFGAKTKIVILAELGSTVPKKNMEILTMPVYCTHIADIFNGTHINHSFTANNESTTRFSAPDARVLVVDDINTNLKVAEGLLTPYKMHIDLCNGGLKAVEAVKSKHYDLVFMDHKMPIMDGVEAAKQIREWEKENGQQSPVPIIALTANAVSGMREMFIENGFNDFISKPIDTVQLNTILEKWIPKEKKGGRKP